MRRGRAHCEREDLPALAEKLLKASPEASAPRRGAPPQPEAGQVEDGPPILSPHAGELSSLSSIVVTKEIDETRSAAAFALPASTMRSSWSRRDEPSRRARRRRVDYYGGGPGLGVSGSGDALAGIVGGLLARGADTADGVALGSPASRRSRRGAYEEGRADRFPRPRNPGRAPRPSRALIIPASCAVPARRRRGARRGARWSIPRCRTEFRP